MTRSGGGANSNVIPMASFITGLLTLAIGAFLTLYDAKDMKDSIATNKLAICALSIRVAILEHRAPPDCPR